MGKKEQKSLITKGRYELRFRGTECLNCGHLLDMSDKYCPNCSQANSTKKLVLKDFFDEFFSSLVDYDSKLLKTLFTLLIRPGTITKDYIRGKRVSYTNPFRFLLSLAFLYFLMFTYNTNFSGLDKIGENLEDNIQKTGPFSYSYNPERSSETNDSTAAVDSRVPIDSTISQYIPLDSLKNVNPNFTVGLGQLDSIISAESRNDMIKDSFMLANPRAYFKSLDEKSGLGTFSDKMEFFGSLLRKDSIRSFEDAQARYGIVRTTNNKLAYSFSDSGLRAIRSPGAFLNATFSRLPFVIFFFLPVFTIFIWVVYIRKKYTYTDHLVFSFHNQSLLFILLIISLIIDTIFDIGTGGLFLSIFGFYLYKAMRNFYGQSRFKTIVKYIFLNTVFAFLAFFTMLLLLAGSVFTY